MVADVGARKGPRANLVNFGQFRSGVGLQRRQEKIVSVHNCELRCLSEFAVQPHWLEFPVSDSSDVSTEESYSAAGRFANEPRDTFVASQFAKTKRGEAASPP